MKGKSKVGVKLLGVNLLSLLVAVVSLLVVIQHLAARQILKWHQERVELVAHLVLAEYQGNIQRVMQAAKLLADNPDYGELLATGNTEALRRLITPLMKAAGLHILTITDAEGVIRVRAHAPEAIGVNISTNPVVRSALKGKGASRLIQWQDSLSLSASAPITFQDRLVGVVLAGFIIDRGFVDSLSRPGAEVAIFFANRLVVNSFKDLPDKALASLRQAKDLAAASAGAGRPQSLRLGDQDYTITYLPLEGEAKPWDSFIMVGVNRRELEPAMSTLKQVIFGVGLGSALIGALLSTWLSYGMRRQIAHLTEGIRQAARQELSGDILVTSQDELGELAESFNSMARALREKTHQLEEERDRIAANADFLAMIVHDIKAPLTGVRLTIEALEDETLPPELYRKLQGIIQKSEGLLLHLHNVLDLSRVEAGRLALNPEAVPPGFVIMRLLHHFGPLAQQQGVNLTSTLAPDLPPMRVDEPTLERVLANLVVNALAAIPAGGEIRVQGRLSPGPNHPEVELIVSDNGPGLASADQGQLFEKFRSRGHKASSSGLGLYICKTLMEANQGRIWVESTPGQGAHFHLALPVAVADAEAASASQVS